MNEKTTQPDLLINNDENRLLFAKSDSCDKFDYIAAVACGAMGGVIDIFLVGSPGDSVLGNWTDKQVDNVVMDFAKKMGWNPKSKNSNNIHSAIGFLEHGRSSGIQAIFKGSK